MIDNKGFDIILVDLPMILPSDTIRVQPPLWAAFLASNLPEAKYIDARVEKGAVLTKYSEWCIYGISITELTELIIKQERPIIGIHVGVSTELGVAAELVLSLQEQSKNKKIILGGPGISIIPDEFLPKPIIPNMVCRAKLGDSESWEEWKKYGFQDNFNSLPNRKIWDQYEEEYQRIGCFHSGPPLLKPAAQIVTSVGCGRGCTFCPTSHKKFQRRDIVTYKEISYLLHEKGIKCIQIEDDNFFGCQYADISEGVSIFHDLTEDFEAIEFPNGLTVHGMLSTYWRDSQGKQYYGFSDELSKALEKNNIQVKLSLPFDSSSDEMLKRIHRPHKREDCELLLKKILFLRSKGLKLEVFFQLGFITVGSNNELVLEEMETINETLSWAMELTIRGLEVNVWFNSTLPGTQLFSYWRQRFPNASWENLLFSLPSLLYPKDIREDLQKRVAAFRAYSIAKRGAI